MTVDELTEWMAYDQIDPIGGYRTDLGFALLAYLQAGNKDSQVSDYLVIDPDPMTDDEREAFEAERLAEEAKREVAALIAMWNR